jgi:(E)-4-hydroxy-3-methylbut-2-enyl-diphosphate synthase
VNFGSLEKELDAKVRSGAMRVSEALCESALGHLRILEDEGFRDVVISVKASDVMTTLESYRLLSERTDCPLHLGVTEAGTLLPGTVRNSVALGILLSEGIGDTIRVSLTAEPEREVRAGMEILRSLGMKPAGPAITSCPTCGRTKVNLFKVAAEVESALEAYALSHGGAGAAVLPRVAVMGCVVNGPGEAKGADVALCGANGEFVLFVKGQNVGRVSESEAASKVMEYVVSIR